MWFGFMCPAGLLMKHFSNAHLPYWDTNKMTEEEQTECGRAHVWAAHGYNVHMPLPTYPSARGQSRLGPRTMAMLLGVILFIACCSDRRDRNWTRYLAEESSKKHTEEGEVDIMLFKRFWVHFIGSKHPIVNTYIVQWCLRWKNLNYAVKKCSEYLNVCFF